MFDLVLRVFNEHRYTRLSHYTLSTHDAPLAHGLATHSSSSTSQLVPVKPG